MRIKNILKSVIAVLAITGFSVASVALAAYTTSQGGTGTSTAGANLLLIGKSDGSGWTQIATSSLGITSGGSGTVTSVALTTPTGLTVSGSPITTSGTFGLSLTAGYNIPLTASTTQWNSFYTTPSTQITAGTGLNWSGNTLNNSGVLSIGGLTGAVATTSLGFPSYTFSTGLTNTANTITDNIATGKTGGQTIIGGTAGTDGLIVKLTTGNDVGNSFFEIKGGNNGATSIAQFGTGQISLRKHTVTAADLVVGTSLIVNGAAGIAGNVSLGNFGSTVTTGGGITVDDGSGDFSNTNFGPTFQWGGFSISSDSLYDSAGIITASEVDASTLASFGGWTFSGDSLSDALGSIDTYSIRSEFNTGSTQCAQFNSSGDLLGTGSPCGSGGGGVTSLSNSDGTLTISPTTGASVASLALGHANTWTGIQTINRLIALTSTTTSATTTNLFATSTKLINATTTTFAITGLPHSILATDNNGNVVATTTSIGTVTSVALTTPTGLTISGSPITTSGTLALALQSGYIIPTTASTTNYDNFFGTPSTRITAGNGLTWAGNTLSSNFTTTATGLIYTAGTGVLSTTAGYGIPLTASTTNWNNFFNTPSTQITAGTGLSWSGNTLNSTFTSSQWTTSGTTISYTTGNVGIGSSTPNFTFVVASSTANNTYLSYNASAAPSSDIFQIATSSVNVFGVDSAGHTYTGGTAPTISSCGTSPSVTGDDQTGTIVVGSGTVTACTMTFAQKYTNAPVCTISDSSTSITPDVSSVSTTAITFGFSATIGGGNIYYQCRYHK